MPGPFDSRLFASAFVPFYDVSVAVYGERRDSRPIGMTIMCSVVEGSPIVIGDTVAPIRERMFGVTFPRSSWVEPTPPQVGEWLFFRFADEDIRAKVANVGHLPDGDYELTVVVPQGGKGGPEWLA